MEPIHERVAGMDVHRMEHVVTVLVEQEDGTLLKDTRKFGGFKRDMRALIDWLRSHRIQQVVMESTGIYWKSVFSHLEAAGIPALVVNAFHVKSVPGRKTDVTDSEWLAQLARFGLLRGSFIPPKDLRELRVVSRYRRKLGQSLAGEKNRLHKLLDDAGIKLGGVVSDINGVCARKMVEGLLAGGTPAELAALGRGKLKRPSEVLEAAMDGDLSPRHRLVLSTVLNHLHYLEREVARLDRYLIEAMKPYAWAWRLLQTIPGIDEISAALILIEIGDDMRRFASPSRLAKPCRSSSVSRSRIRAPSRRRRSFGTENLLQTNRIRMRLAAREMPSSCRPRSRFPQEITARGWRLRFGWTRGTHCADLHHARKVRRLAIRQCHLLSLSLGRAPFALTSRAIMEDPWPPGSR